MATPVPKKSWFARDQLSTIPIPQGNGYWQPIPHLDYAQTVIETLKLRGIRVDAERYALSEEGAKMFGVLETSCSAQGARFLVGIQNAHDKSLGIKMFMGCTTGACENLIFFREVRERANKHCNNFSLQDFLSVGLDEFQRALPMLEQNIVRAKETHLDQDAAKLFIYRLFVAEDTNLPHHLIYVVHREYFEAEDNVYSPGNEWALRNAFANALFKLNPIQHFKTALTLSRFF